MLKKSLKDREDKTDLILDTYVAGIITMNASEIILSVNPAAEKMFKYSSNELVGKNINFIMSDRDSRFRNKHMNSDLRTRKSKIIGSGREMLGRKKDGTIFPIYLSLNEVKLPGQKIFIGIIHDITVTKTAEDKLEREASIVRQNPGPVFRTDYSGVLLYANPAAQKLFGKGVVGKNIISILKGITSSKIKRVSSKKPILLEQDIDEKYYQLTIVKDIISKNLIIYGLNITHHKLAEEEALRRSEDKFKQFFENEPDYCYMISPKGKILDVNKAALNALGYKKEELVGKSVLTIYPKEMHDKAKKNVAIFNKTGILLDVEYEVITKSGERRNVLLNASSVRDSDGNILHSISVQKDITDQIKNQKEKDTLSLDLSNRLKELSCLQRINILIEGEIPISKLFLKIAEIVPSGLRYPERAWAKIIFDDIDYVINEKNYNEDFMAGSDIAVSGKLRGILKIGYNDDIEFLPEEIDMIHNITLRLTMLIERNELRENLMQQEKLEAVQKLAAAVAHEFNQPLQALQLLSSAANREIIKSDPDLLELIPEQVANISDLVNKLLNVTTYETKVYTTGREIVDIHKAGDTKRNNDKKVLVVDDDRAILKLMSRIIENSGYNVKSASNAKEALKLIMENQFNLVISDISLPGMSGIELYKKVRNRYESLDFIFMSGYAVDDMDESIIESVAGFFPKPFQIQSVMDTISKILSN